MATALAVLPFVATIGGAIIGSKGTKAATEAAVEGGEAARADIQQATAQARGDILPLFAGGAESRQQGTQDALNFLTGALPNQIQPFQQGNIAAQQQLARGLPQIQNAILGNQVDLSGFQPQQIGFQIPQLPQQAQQTAGPVVGGATPFAATGGGSGLHPFNNPVVGGAGILGGVIPSRNTKLRRRIRDFER